MRKGTLKNLALTAIATAITVNAYAVAPGLYVGIMMGPATNNANPQPARTFSGNPPFVMANPKSSQFGSRIDIGYKFNPYASFEGGVNYFTGINYDTHGVQPCSGSDERVRDIDILGKLDYTFRGSIGVFGKAGVGVTYITSAGSFNGASCKSQYNNKFTPTATLGVSYDLNQNWVTDISWTRIEVGGVVSSVDFFGIGLAYHFVDKYCGQFLCDD